MGTSFALDLSKDGIRLTYLLNGVWTVLGDANFHSPHLEQNLAELRSIAQSLHRGPLLADIVIPRSHIRYETTSWHSDERDMTAIIERKLADVAASQDDELDYDWVHEGRLIRLAIVERLTLLEADRFAVEHGFTPATLTARPRLVDFPRAPVFPTPWRSGL